MRAKLTRALALGAALALAGGAIEAQGQSQSAPQAEAAAPRKAPAPAVQACIAGAIGVSRTVEIDTAKGPRLGNQQYPDIDFLADGEVVLTFDDGPLRPHTRPILDALAAHCTKATFFMVGRMAIADPEMAREVAGRGHTVATHTWSHRNLRSAGPTKARAEVELGLSAVSKAVGTPVSPFFRFPYLSDPKDTIGYLQAREMGIFSIDIDSVDFRTRNPADVHRKIMGQLATKKKGILLFHDIQPSTAGALKGLLDDLARRGFKIVHIVPKGAAKTLPEYDAEAEQLLARKKVAAVAQPLATRSVVWPVSTPPAAGAPPSADARKRPAAGGAAGPPGKAAAAQPAPVPAPAPVQVVAPPSAGAAMPQPVPTVESLPPAPRAPRVSEDKPWQERVFGQ